MPVKFPLLCYISGIINKLVSSKIMHNFNILSVLIFPPIIFYNTLKYKYFTDLSFGVLHRKFVCKVVVLFYLHSIFSNEL
jgi:hypothetical protein